MALSKIMRVKIKLENLSGEEETNWKLLITYLRKKYKMTIVPIPSEDTLLFECGQTFCKDYSECPPQEEYFIKPQTITHPLGL